MPDFLNKIITSSKYILALLVVFLLGAAAGIIVFYQLNVEVFAIKKNWNELEQKFRSKIENSSFPLMASSQLENTEKEVSVIFGEVEEADSVSHSLLLKVKNIYKGGSVIDFIVNQADFYRIKILTDEKTRFIDYVWEPGSSTSTRQAGQGLGIIDYTPPPEREIELEDLKKNQEVAITLRDKIYLSKTTSAKADIVRALFISQPPPAEGQNQTQ